MKLRWMCNGLDYYAQRAIINSSVLISELRTWRIRIEFILHKKL